MARRLLLHFCSHSIPKIRATEVEVSLHLFLQINSSTCQGDLINALLCKFNNIAHIKKLPISLSILDDYISHFERYYNSFIFQII